MAFRNKHGKNAGFSLVELLVGVMILTIVVAPLLHAIITSGNMAKKSREMQNATLAARNLAESMDALRLGDILTAVKTTPDDVSSMFSKGVLYSYDGSDYTEIADQSAVTAGDQTYYIGLKDIKTSTSTFDAMVKMDATSFAQNDHQVSLYTPMNAVFSQPSVGKNGEIVNPDIIAATSLASEAALLDGGSYNADDFLHKMVRTINVHIVKSGSNVTASAEYSYSASHTYIAGVDGDGDPISATATLPADPGTCRYNYVFYTGSAADFKSVYFFYFPNYSSRSNAECINIYNTNGLPITFFLIKQYTPYILDEALLGAFETAYDDAVLSLREPFGSQTRPYATIYTNMNVILKDGENLNFNTSLLLSYNGAWYTYENSSGKLVATDDLKRLFKVTISLYPAGSNFTGTPALVFDASKLD